MRILFLQNYWSSDELERINEQSISALWQALCTAEDYFALLGGSARYEGFQVWHPAGLVAVIGWTQLLPTSHESSAARRLLPQAMFSETDDLTERVRRILDSQGFTERVALDALLERLDGMSSSWTKPVRHDWKRFKSEFRALVQHD